MRTQSFLTESEKFAFLCGGKVYNSLKTQAHRRMKPRILLSFALLLAALPTAAGEEESPIITLPQALEAAEQGNLRPLNELRKTQDMMHEGALLPEDVDTTLHVPFTAVDSMDPTGDMLMYRAHPSAAPGDVLLFLHGGSWVYGTPQQYHILCGRAAAEGGVDVANAAFRLAPESPYPAAYNDVLAAVTTLEQMGYKRIFLAGAGTGANLAAAAALVLKKRVAGCILYYPLLSAEPDGSIPTGEMLIDEEWRRDQKACMRAYAGKHNPAEPGISPLAAESVEDFPPCLIVVAGCDPLRIHGTRFAQKLQTAGREAMLLNIPTAHHHFMSPPLETPEFEAGLDALLRFLRQHTAP